MSDTPIATYSSLGQHQQCKRAWAWGNYFRLRPIEEKQDGPLPFGSRIHEALEAYYNGTVDRSAQAWAPLMEEAFKKAEEQGTYSDRLEKENTLGHVMLEGYDEWVESEGEDAKWETVGVEKALSNHLTMVVDTGTLAGEQEVTVLVRGKLDRLLRRKSDGALYVGDFKTTKSTAETAIGDLVLSPQPRMYLLLQKANSPDEVAAGFVITLLRKVLRTKTARPPFYLRVQQEVSPVELESYRVRMEGAVQDLVTTRKRLDAGQPMDRAAYFTPGWWCSTCPFKAPCSIRQDTPAGSDAMIADLYTEHDPLTRYLKAMDGTDPEEI